MFILDFSSVALAPVFLRALIIEALNYGTYIRSSLKINLPIPNTPLRRIVPPPSNPPNIVQPPPSPCLRTQPMR